MNVTDRFIKYISFDTQSDSRSSQTPSTHGQLMLAAYLAEELLDLGIRDAHCDEYGCV
jgi:tripeptide aminopeptidase